MLVHSCYKAAAAIYPHTLPPPRPLFSPGHSHKFLAKAAQFLNKACSYLDSNLSLPGWANFYCFYLEWLLWCPSYSSTASDDLNEIEKIFKMPYYQQALLTYLCREVKYFLKLLYPFGWLYP